MRAAKNRTPNHTLPEQVLHYRCTDAALLETISSIWIYQNRRDVPEPHPPACHHRQRQLPHHRTRQQPQKSRTTSRR
ncbi:hypothetical protein [Cardiobacterium hominis]